MVISRNKGWTNKKVTHRRKNKRTVTRGWPNGRPADRAGHLVGVAAPVRLVRLALLARPADAQLDTPADLRPPAGRHAAGARGQLVQLGRRGAVGRAVGCEAGPAARVAGLRGVADQVPRGPSGAPQSGHSSPQAGGPRGEFVGRAA